MAGKYWGMARRSDRFPSMNLGDVKEAVEMWFSADKSVVEVTAVARKAKGSAAKGVVPSIASLKPMIGWKIGGTVDHCHVLGEITGVREQGDDLYLDFIVAATGDAASAKVMHEPARESSIR